MVIKTLSYDFQAPWHSSKADNQALGVSSAVVCFLVSVGTRGCTLLKSIFSPPWPAHRGQPAKACWLHEFPPVSMKQMWFDFAANGNGVSSNGSSVICWAHPGVSPESGGRKKQSHVPVWGLHLEAEDISDVVLSLVFSAVRPDGHLLSVTRGEKSLPASPPPEQPFRKL